ncbi:hypothetical protein EsH8_I_001012 [Colletotrichum jinshuiense]
MFQLTDLPETLFLDILSLLAPREVVLYRLVSRASHAALTRPDISRALLHVFFPDSLECRLLRSRASSGIQGEKSSFPGREPAEPPEAATAVPDWPVVFASVSRRYHNLSTGAFHSITTIPVLKDPKLLRPFAPWNRFLRCNDMLAPLQFCDPSWTYADGVLVYPSSSTAPLSRLSCDSSPSPSPKTESTIPVFRALDVNSGYETMVPFDWTAKVVRRARLAQGILIIEWAEAQGSHPLNECDVAHRHFATAFDVRDVSLPSLTRPCPPLSDRGGSSTAESGGDRRGQGPAVTFRSEWKIHYLGLPLSAQDRLLSTHNATHYALYAHQPIRSPWGEDSPLERLVVWSLNDPSPYKPSLDPSSSQKPPSDPGPSVVQRLTNGELDHWGIRQRETPRLMQLALDTAGSEDGHVFLHEEDHTWAAGPQSSESPPARHTVRSTGIPLSGIGPRWVDECGAEGDAERSFCPAARPDAGRGEPVPGSGSETWPGRAPCWRHEEFPYLTVAQVVDPAAGTRVCGRRCFTMETVSASVVPGCSGRARGATPAATTRAGAADAGAGAGAEEAGRGEVQFGDDLWRALMAGAALAGDERWVIGENAAGDVSVVRF